MIPFDPAIHGTRTGKPLSESSWEERAQQLHEALNRLPIESREILALREIEGWSYEQLASALKVPLGTVMPRLSRARLRLRLRQEFTGVRQQYFARRFVAALGKVHFARPNEDLPFVEKTNKTFLNPKPPRNHAH
jgi:hypothetical protein